MEKEEKKYILFGTELSKEAVNYLVDAIVPPIIEVAKHGAINGWNEEKIKAATRATAMGIAWGVKSIKG